jgi:hypothetical protein
VKTPDLPAELTDGVFTSVEPDGRVKFAFIRHRKVVGDVVLPAHQASQLAANPFVRITGLGLGPCPIEGHACLVIRVGAAELGFAFPRAKLKEFGKWVAANEALDK